MNYLYNRSKNGQQSWQCSKASRNSTKNGCKIKVRLGLHEVSEDACSNDGIIVLQPYGNKEDVEALVNELNSLEGITASYLDLN